MAAVSLHLCCRPLRPQVGTPAKHLDSSASERWEAGCRFPCRHALSMYPLIIRLQTTVSGLSPDGPKLHGSPTRSKPSCKSGFSTFKDLFPRCTCPSMMSRGEIDPYVHMKEHVIEATNATDTTIHTHLLGGCTLQATAILGGCISQTPCISHQTPCISGGCPHQDLHWTFTCFHHLTL
jgi:hypothetical protein